MSESNVPADQSAEHREERLSVLFAQLMMQQANMALMYLGRTAHPESGQPIKNLEAAKLFIDELEMLEAKTKGNLSKEEEGMLKQTLMSLRLAFVEEVEKPEAAAPEAKPESGASDTQSPSTPEPAQEDEHRKKFSKKY